MLTLYGHKLSPFDRDLWYINCSLPNLVQWSLSIKIFFVNLRVARMAQMTLELLGMEYDFKQIDLMKNEQKEEWYLKINPKVKQAFSVNSEVEPF